MQQVAAKVIVAVCLLFGDIDVKDQFRPANVQMTEDGVAVMEGVPADVVEWLVPPDGADPSATRPEGYPKALLMDQMGFAAPRPGQETRDDWEPKVLMAEWPHGQQWFYLERQGDDIIRRLELAEKDGYEIAVTPAGVRGFAHVRLKVEVVRQALTGGRYDETLEAYVERPVLRREVCEPRLRALPGTASVLLWETPEADPDAPASALPADRVPAAIAVVLVVAGAGTEEPVVEGLMYDVAIEVLGAPAESEITKAIFEADDQTARAREAIAAGDVQVLMAPRCALVDGKRGEVRVADAVPCPVPNSRTGETEQVTGDVTNTFALTPSIAADGSISLVVDITVRQLAALVPAPLGGPIQISNYIETKTRANVRSGEAALVGLGACRWAGSVLALRGEGGGEARDIFILITPTITNPDALPDELRAKVMGLP